MLTGKFKRNAEPESLTRASVLDKLFRDGKFQFSMWDEVKQNDQYWNLIEIMERIAKKQGEFCKVDC